MTKPFASCTLPDLVYEMFLDARAAATPLLPRLADAQATEAALQRHPLVRGASGLVCIDTAESRQAWCSICVLYAARLARRVRRGRERR
jgi:hypothetical protein